MQRTRCSYFRDVAVSACNKRIPARAAPRWTGTRASTPCWREARLHRCPSVGHVRGAGGARGAGARARPLPDGVTERVIPMADFHLLPGTTPEHETSLAPGELITHVMLKPTPVAARSVYVKARDRASYAFALASAAAGLHIEGGKIRAARVALGGVATKPWRSAEAEQALVGHEATRATFEKAAAAALRAAQSRARQSIQGTAGHAPPSFAPWNARETCHEHGPLHQPRHRPRRRPAEGHRSGARIRPR